MRYIDLNAVIDSIPQGIRDNLQAVDQTMPLKNDADKATSAAVGNVHWSPVKQYLENASNRKCWYTETKNPGCLNDVEHYRPKAKVTDGIGNVVHWYWFLAFNPINYRLSSQLPNRLNENPVLGETGGKGNKFPLLPGSPRATDLAGLGAERPIILDPCSEADTGLLEFQPDGRPVLSMRYVGDPAAEERVEQSKLLLNLDYPTFNEDRESLYNTIKMMIERGDRYIRDGIPAIDDVKNDLRDMMSPDAAYSKAAECYIRCFRDRAWVEELILPNA
jgi:hypothetical protein